MMPKKREVHLFLLDNLIWVILVGFFLINAVITPRFLTFNNVVNIFYHSAIMSMLVLGQGLILITGHLDLSIESTMAFAPGVAMLLANKWLPGGLHPILIILATLLIGALVGMFNGYCITKIKVNPFLQTLSMLIILRGLVLFLVPFSIFPLPDLVNFFGQARIFAGNVPVAIPLILIIYAIFHVILRYTPFGRRFIATGGNEEASFISGIKTDKIIIMAFVLSGLLAAVAGLLAAGRQGSISNSMGDGMVLLSFAGAILGGTSLDGGKGKALGMLGGAILLGMFSNSLNLLGVNVSLVHAAEGALIFLAIIMDRVRVKIRQRILHQEQVERLLHQEGNTAEGV